LAIFTIATFSTFVGLLIAARKLATDPDILNKGRALANLATDGKALAAAVRASGLTPLAEEMVRQAEEVARHFTHPGRARDDAIALFWQVAPDAFADPDALVAAALDSDRATDRMVASIKASSHARDFAAIPLAEPFFRAVARQTLAVLAKADFVNSIAPDLWRRTLSDHGVQLELLERIDATVTSVEETTRRTEATTLRIESVVVAQSQARLEDAERKGTAHALQAISLLFAEMNSLGISPQQLTDLLSHMRCNFTHIDEVICLVRSQRIHQ
jgi:hypothetical protein